MSGRFRPEADYVFYARIRVVLTHSIFSHFAIASLAEPAGLIRTRRPGTHMV